jgi:hypothetical protein
LLAGLAFSTLYSSLDLHRAFSSEYWVRDDARQHVFWMLRFLDPDLFPHDRIADYFQSVAPIGYSSLYHLAALGGIEPFLFNKLLPTALGWLTTYFCFQFCLTILPVPATAFAATLLLNQGLWMNDDLVSGTPRAFTYALFLAFVYYLAKRSLLPCLLAIALTSVFYPQFVFLCAGLLGLQLFDWLPSHGWLSMRKDWRFATVGLGVALVVLLPYVLQVSEFGPTLTVAQARQLPEFYGDGRAAFFSDSFSEYWLWGRRSGLLSQSLLTPVTLIFGLLLPFLVCERQRLAILQHLSPTAWLLPQIVLVSTGMFLAAHALLFQLHLPSRYVEHTFRIVLTLAAAIALSALVDAALQWALHPHCSRGWLRSATAAAVTAIAAITLVGYPAFVREFPLGRYRVGNVPDLYEYLQAQPKDSLVASLAPEASNLPSFARRSILVGDEYAIPYHYGYYRTFRQRVREVIQAQYTLDPAQLEALTDRYGIDFWLLERDSFAADYIADSDWIGQHQPEADRAIAILDAGRQSALASVAADCSAWENESLQLVEMACALQSLHNPG